MTAAIINCLKQQYVWLVCYFLIPSSQADRNQNQHPRDHDTFRHLRRGRNLERRLRGARKVRCGLRRPLLHCGVQRSDAYAECVRRGAVHQKRERNTVFSRRLTERDSASGRVGFRVKAARIGPVKCDQGKRILRWN